MMIFCANRLYGALLRKSILGGMVLAGCAISADNKQPIKAETLLRTSSSWDQVPYKNYPQGQPELTIVKYTLPAHTTMAWHTHTMPMRDMSCPVSYWLKEKMMANKSVSVRGKPWLKGSTLHIVV